MGRLCLNRGGFSLMALLLISFILFVLTRAIPGSPARIAMGYLATEAQLQQFNRDHGLDRPIIVQYGAWLRQVVLHGNFGKSVVTELPTNRRIAATLPITLELVILGFAFAMILSILLGTLSAFHEGAAIDYIARVFSVVGVSVPGFWLGLLLILTLAVDRPWFPPGGFVPLSAGIGSHLRCLVLPAFSLGIYYTAILSRMTRSSMVEVLGQDYIRNALAVGLPRRLIFFYVLKNALVPVVTVGAMSFGYMFGWALVIETVFNIPGLSSSLLVAIHERDFAFLQAAVLVFTGIFLIANFIADVVNVWLNPRLRAPAAK